MLPNKFTGLEIGNRTSLGERTLFCLSQASSFYVPVLSWVLKVQRQTNRIVPLEKIIPQTNSKNWICYLKYEYSLERKQNAHLKEKLHQQSTLTKGQTYSRYCSKHYIYPLIQQTWSTYCVLGSVGGWACHSKWNTQKALPSCHRE